MIRIFPKKKRINVLDTYVHMNSLQPQFNKQNTLNTNVPSYTFDEHPLLETTKPKWDRRYTLIVFKITHLSRDLLIT